MLSYETVRDLYHGAFIERVFLQEVYKNDPTVDNLCKMIDFSNWTSRLLCISLDLFKRGNRWKTS